MNITKGKYANDVGDGYWSKSNGASTTTPVTTTPTTDPGEIIGIATALGTMNVRTAPNTNGKILGTIKRGTAVNVLEITSNNWYKILYKDNVAYVSNSNSKYFTYTAKAVTSTTPTTLTEPASKKNPVYGATEIPNGYNDSIKGTYTITAAKSMNIRKGPGTGFDILYAVSNTAKFISDGYYTDALDGTRWLYGKVQIKSIIVEGLASSKLLKKE